MGQDFQAAFKEQFRAKAAHGEQFEGIGLKEHEQQQPSFVVASEMADSAGEYARQYGNEEAAGIYFLFDGLLFEGVHQFRNFYFLGASHGAGVARSAEPNGETAHHFVFKARPRHGDDPAGRIIHVVAYRASGAASTALNAAEEIVAAKFFYDFLGEERVQLFFVFHFALNFPIRNKMGFSSAHHFKFNSLLHEPISHENISSHSGSKK